MCVTKSITSLLSLLSSPPTRLARPEQHLHKPISQCCKHRLLDTALFLTFTFLCLLLFHCVMTTKVSHAACCPKKVLLYPKIKKFGLHADMEAEFSLQFPVLPQRSISWMTLPSTGEPLFVLCIHFSHKISSEEKLQIYL